MYNDETNYLFDFEYKVIPFFCIFQGKNQLKQDNFARLEFFKGNIAIFDVK